MTAKEYLEQLRTIDNRINALIGYRDKIIDEITNISPDPSKEKVISGRQYSRVEHSAIALVDLTAEIDHEIDILIDLKREATHKIEALHDIRYRMVLVYRYVHNKPWGRISRDMSYSKTQTWRLHDEALKVFQETWN